MVTRALPVSSPERNWGDRLIAVALLVVLGAAFALASARSRRSALQPAAATATTTLTDACARLRERLCQELGATSSACELARRETARFSDAHCAGMLTRFADVKRELHGLDQGMKVLVAREQSLIHGLAPAVGSADATLTLVEFCDFQTPDCGRFSPVTHMLENLYPGRARLVFRQYPSPKHAHAELAAEASLAANAQGKFWEYHDVLFSNPHDLRRPALERYAEQVQLDMPAFRRALDEHTFLDDVRADVELGHRLQALDRPTLFANGKRVSVPYGAEELERLVKNELGGAR
ncbi:MAG: DsbA family protein [Myxococcota bacterium]